MARLIDDAHAALREGASSPHSASLIVSPVRVVPQRRRRRLVYAYHGSFGASGRAAKTGGTGCERVAANEATDTASVGAMAAAQVCGTPGRIGVPQRGQSAPALRHPGRGAAEGPAVGLPDSLAACFEAQGWAWLGSGRSAMTNRSIFIPVWWPGCPVARPRRISAHLPTCGGLGGLAHRACSVWSTSSRYTAGTFGGLS